MKKYFALIILAMLTTASCEQDFICIDAVTPNLTIRFYDFENKSNLKEVEGLTVWAKDKDSIFKNVKLDSISIPLNLNTNFTVYKFAHGEVVDELNFNYDRKTIFVGRSCGYKINFENFNAENKTNNWIKEIKIMNTTIKNDTLAQIHIFH